MLKFECGSKQTSLYDRVKAQTGYGVVGAKSWSMETGDCVRLGLIESLWALTSFSKAASVLLVVMKSFKNT